MVKIGEEREIKQYCMKCKKECTNTMCSGCFVYDRKIICLNCCKFTK